MRSQGLRMLCAALLLLAAWSCRSTGGPNPPADYATPAAAADAPLVAPLADEGSDQILSWVDGQVITDWASEIARRDRAIDGYLNDTDPGRAAKYGFRKIGRASCRERV